MAAHTPETHTPTTDPTARTPNDKHDDDHIQRIVIFFGPHKTASTSIEKFLVTHAGDTVDDKEDGSFRDWTWPTYRANDDGNALYRLNAKQNPDRLQIYQQSIQSAISTTKNHVVLGTENLDKFDETGALELLWNWTSSSLLIEADTLDEKNDEQENHKLHRRPLQYEFIVNHRTPRINHLISVWKQNSRQSMKASGWSFFDYWCHRKQHPYPTRHHSLHLVQRLLQFWSTKQSELQQQQQHQFVPPQSSPSSVSSISSTPWNATITTTTIPTNIEGARRQIRNNLIIHLIDMAGVTHAGLDISHVVACHILQVPCQTHRHEKDSGGSSSASWVKGLNPEEAIIQANTGRSEASTNLSTTQLQAMDTVLRHYDCTFSYLQQYENRNHDNSQNRITPAYQSNFSPWVRILYPHELFQDCPKFFPYLSMPPPSFSLPPIVPTQPSKGDTEVQQSSRAPHVAATHVPDDMDPIKVQHMLRSLRDYDLVTEVIRDIIQCPSSTQMNDPSSRPAWDLWTNLTKSLHFSNVLPRGVSNKVSVTEPTTIATRHHFQDSSKVSPVTVTPKTRSSPPSALLPAVSLPKLADPQHQSKSMDRSRAGKWKTRRSFSSSTLTSEPPLVLFGPTTIIIMTTSLVLVLAMVVWTLRGCGKQRPKLRIRRRLPHTQQSAAQHTTTSPRPVTMRKMVNV